jgi:membrane protein DedA with SNARE-associated domain
MEQWILDFLQSVMNSHDIVLYLVLFGSAVIENLFPPIPGDTITAFGAFLVGTGRLDYFLVYLSTTLGSVIGFTLLFLVGKFLGWEFFIRGNFPFFSSGKILAAEKWFQKYGYTVVLANRFLPGIRSAISIFAGISYLSTLKVFIYALISSSLWNLIWIHMGYTLGNNWEVVKTKMQYIIRNYNIGVAVVLAVIVGVYLIRRLRKNPPQRNDPKY